MGKDPFNDEFLHNAIASVNDVATNPTQKEKQTFVDMVKSITADDDMLLRRMYQQGIQSVARPRSGDMNDDSASIQLLPDGGLHHGETAGS